MVKALSAFLLLASPHAFLRNASSTVSVYVTAHREALEHLPHDEAEDLQDSVADLRQQIGKRDRLALASDAKSADIILTVLERRMEFRHSRTTDYGGGMRQSQYQSRYVLAYRLEAGGQVAEGEYYQDGSLVTWRRVAGGLVRDIERWVEDHRELLAEDRLSH